MGAIKQLKILLMSDALMASIVTLHIIGIIMADRSKFSFIGSIPKAMFRGVPPSSKILEGYRSLTPSRPRPLNDEFQAILAEVDKTKKGGRGSKKATKKDTANEGPSGDAKPRSKKRKAPAASTAAPKRRKQSAKRRKSPTPTSSQSEGDNSGSDTESEIRIEEDPLVRNTEDDPVHIEEQEFVRIEEVEQVHNEPPIRTEAPSPNREVTPPLNDHVPSSLPSPKTTTSIHITIAPLPPHILSQPPATIPVSIPIFHKIHHFVQHLCCTYKIDSEDEVSTTKGELKSLHEKIDQLILRSKVSTSEAYSKAAVEKILERVTEEHTANVSTLSKVVSDFTDASKSMTEKVDKLIADTIEFMEDYKNTYNANTMTANKAIKNSSIAVKITKLQEDLAAENKITDALAIKEEKCKVLGNKLHYTTKQIDDLLAEKAVMRSCISDVTGLLSDIIETHNPMISITVKKHLAEKLRPVFAMLHHLEEPIIDDSKDEEPDEDELKRRKAREAEIDKHVRIVKEAEEKERVEKEAQATLKSKMLLFPKWTLKRIQNQVVDMPSQYWLDPIASFEIQNTQDSQLYLPITPKAFRFRAFVKVANQMKHQYETWSASKVVAVKITGPIETESFPNAKFKFARGSTCQAYEFTLADLPCLNPHDWMVIYNILLRQKEKYEPVVSHLELFIKSYIQEVGMMDVDIATVLRQKPCVVPKEAPKDFEKLKPGKIYKEGWFMVYTSRDLPEANRRKLYFHLEGKHLFTITCLEFILELVARFNGNNKDDVKCFTDVITWYIQVRKLLLSFIPKFYEVQKRIKN
uniref:Uncharacterized protein n=1 Tax=Lactuca sativa TaxID=4236 RepID=A0A9R1UJ32_LACSA|nr:hypothetical protein LSAT_V11C900483250 [Lactuca sativa]